MQSCGRLCSCRLACPCPSELWRMVRLLRPTCAVHAEHVHAPSGRNNRASGRFHQRNCGALHFRAGLLMGCQLPVRCWVRPGNMQRARVQWYPPDLASE